MINLKEVFQIYKEKRIKLESESKYRQMWMVGKHSVIIQIKKGRRIIICDCDNHTRFCNSSPLCLHKEAVIAYPIIHIMQEEIKKKIETFKALGLGENEEISKLINMIVFEMEDLEKLLWVRQLKYK